ncbi:hypothetical protein DBV15_08039 [Temnothorax longispinosus]|uniref:Uncharacterized protein n=1 Tax=Temnothorax longispinosus TaxID=300112 RepID=A0A4S2KHF7_9HYME|nr:hypothetical protein DBV15_08039 [Temnothorax longispinosus]
MVGETETGTRGRDKERNSNKFQSSTVRSRVASTSDNELFSFTQQFALDALAARSRVRDVKCIAYHLVNTRRRRMRINDESDTGESVLFVDHHNRNLLCDLCDCACVPSTRRLVLSPIQIQSIGGRGAPLKTNWDFHRTRRFTSASVDLHPLYPLPVLFRRPLPPQGAGARRNESCRDISSPGTMACEFLLVKWTLQIMDFHHHGNPCYTIIHSRFLITVRKARTSPNPKSSAVATEEYFSEGVYIGVNCRGAFLGRRFAPLVIRLQATPFAAPISRPRRCKSLSGRPNVMSLVCFRLHPYGRGTTSAPPGSYSARFNFQESGNAELEPTVCQLTKSMPPRYAILFFRCIAHFAGSVSQKSVLQFLNNRRQATAASHKRVATGTV